MPFSWSTWMNICMTSVSTRNKQPVFLVVCSGYLRTGCQRILSSPVVAPTYSTLLGFPLPGLGFSIFEMKYEVRKSLQFLHSRPEKRGSSNSSEVDLPGAGRRVGSRRSLMLHQGQKLSFVLYLNQRDQ